MKDEQPEAAHAASEVEDAADNPYGDDSVVLKFLAVVILLATLLVAWASVE